MKKRNLVFSFLLLLISFSGRSQTTVTLTTSGTYTVPCNVTSIFVECWGAGGGSGGGTNTAGPGGSGGGGGAYAASTLAVTPGQTFPYTVGTCPGQGAGGTITMFNSGTISATGGTGGAADGGPAGTGGTAGSSVGTVKFSGGNGAIGVGTVGGGGGGAGGSSSPGGNAIGQTGGVGGTSGGGMGGNGQPLGVNGVPGVIPGGGAGGSGRRNGGSEIGVAGANGQIKITFTQPGGTFTIGPGGTYPSITATLPVLQCAAFSGPVIFELLPTYTDASETYPITFPVLSGISPSNTITYRPAASAANLVCDGDPGSGVAFFNFNGANYITLDGRPGGTGTTSHWTIRNTRTAATVGPTIYFQNDASNNALRYLNIEGEAASNYSMIFFSIAAGGSGNDNNTIANCSISDLKVGGTLAYPCTGIYSSGTATKANSGNVIDNNQFVDIYNPAAALSGGIELEANNDSWSITNNHFFQGSAGYANLNTNPWSGVFINSGGGYTVTGNFIGGRAANCGGAAFTVGGGTSQFQGIRFGAVTGAACTVSGNTIANINYTATGVGAGVFPIVCISLGGAVDYTVGSSGNGNTIGSMSSGAGNIVSGNNGTNGAGFCGIFYTGTGTSTISYNNFGGILQLGSRVDAEVDLIHLNSTANVTISNNTFGSTVANNIEVQSNSILLAIYNSTSTNGLNCTNNTFQNFYLSSVSGTKNLYGVLNVMGPLTLTNNTFRNFTSAHGAICNIVRHNGGTTANVDGNLFENITMTNSAVSSILYCIYFNSASACVANNNTIGSGAAGNIQINGDGDNFMIYKTGTGSLSVTNNTIQGLSIGSGGPATGFEAVICAVGTFTCTANSIKNITVNTTSLSDFAAIWSGTASAGVFISDNIIENIFYTNTASVATRNQGIYVTGGSGKITKNFIGKLTNASVFTSAKIGGAQIFSGSWDFINNVVLLDNNASANTLIIYGLESLSTGTVNIYHNTIKVYGGHTGNSISACLRRSGAGIYTVRNNLFQNLRTGGAAGHYAEYAVSGGTYTTNYNYLEVADSPARVGNFGGADYTFANWLLPPVNATNDLTGLTSLNAIGGAPAGFVGANAGFDLYTPAVVVDDKLSAARDAAPWMGSYEGPMTANTINTNPLSSSTLCKGGTISVTFSTTGTYLAGNIFTAQLSDASGSFASPTPIGNITSTVAAPISCVIPVGTPVGSFYRIRVISSNPSIIGTDNGTDLTVPADGGAGTWTWVGSVSSNWFDRCNWDKKCLPDASSDVVIPVTGVDPVISGAAASCNTITINSTTGAVLNINSSAGGSLTITQ